MLYIFCRQTYPQKLEKVIRKKGKGREEVKVRDKSLSYNEDKNQNRLICETKH